LGSVHQGKSNSIEIIDLDLSARTCQNLPAFPVAVEGSIGGTGFQGEPIICGGEVQNNYAESNCFSFKNNKWIPSAGMIRARALTAISPFSSKPSKLLVTGGYYIKSYQLSTAEVLTEQGWKILSLSLPITIFYHCSVLYNATTVMIIGGYQNGLRSPNTFLFNTENEVWMEGPPLMIERNSHSCGRIRQGSHSNEFSIIVAGGWNDSQMSSVEILDRGTNEWRRGPDLPYGIQLSQMIEDQHGGVVLVGGQSSEVQRLDSLFRLPHGGAYAVWTKMEQKLKMGRYWHTAFLVPDNIVDCN
jgi:hypothetical protein